MAKQTTKLLTDQLRQAIDDCGLTRYQIAKETGIDESALAKFYNRHRGLSMEALNALGECLELTIDLGRRAGGKPDTKTRSASKQGKADRTRSQLNRKVSQNNE